MICIYLPGVCITYMILFTSLVQFIAESFEADPKFTNTMQFRAVVGVPCTLVLFFPISMKKDMSAFAYFGIASVIALVYVALLMVIEMPFYYKESMTRPTTKVIAYQFDYNIFTACAITFFAYSCQIQLLPVYSELVNPNFARIRKVIRRSILADMLFYMVIGVSGYLSTFNRT